MLGGVLLVAGLTKVGDPLGTVNSVRAYQLLPDGAAQVVGWSLPATEIVVGALLLAGVATRFAAIAIAVMMAAFTIGVASAWARGLVIDCGCFGTGGATFASEVPVGEYTFVIIRDALFVIGAAALAIRPTSRIALLDREPPPNQTADAPAP